MAVLLFVRSSFRAESLWTLIPSGRSQVPPLSGPKIPTPSEGIPLRSLPVTKSFAFRYHPLALLRVLCVSVFSLREHRRASGVFHALECSPLEFRGRLAMLPAHAMSLVSTRKAFRRHFQNASAVPAVRPSLLPRV